jgi:hypothetical protein
MRLVILLSCYSLLYTRGKQYNENTKKLRNSVCVGPIEGLSVTKLWMFFFCLFTLCSAGVIALVIVLSESPCERIGKWETCPVLKENRSLVCI